MFTLKIEEKAPGFVAEAVQLAAATAAAEHPSDPVKALLAAQIVIDSRCHRRGYSTMKSGVRLDVWKMKDGANVGLPVAMIERPKTGEELLAEYESTRVNVVREWNHVYAQGKAAVAEFVEKSKADQAMYLAGAFVYEVKWGRAVAEDLAAEHASRILAAFDDGHPCERVLDWTVEQLTRDLMGSAYRPTSTSPFSNAVDIARATVAQSIIEKCKAHLSWLRDARANCEVL